MISLAEVDVTIRKALLIMLTMCILLELAAAAYSLV
jgi:hypothetical protein